MASKPPAEAPIATIGTGFFLGGGSWALAEFFMVAGKDPF
jgi:hypothetical protein